MLKWLRNGASVIWIMFCVNAVQQWITFCISEAGDIFTAEKNDDISAKFISGLEIKCE